MRWQVEATGVCGGRGQQWDLNSVFLGGETLKFGFFHLALFVYHGGQSWAFRVLLTFDMPLAVFSSTSIKRFPIVF